MPAATVRSTPIVTIRSTLTAHSSHRKPHARRTAITTTITITIIITPTEAAPPITTPAATVPDLAQAAHRAEAQEADIQAAAAAAAVVVADTDIRSYCTEQTSQQFRADRCYIQ